MRDLTFFDGLRAALEAERRAEEAEAERQRHDLTARERVEAGLALADLSAVEESTGLGGRTLVTFERPAGAPLETRLDPGTCVAVRRRADDGGASVRATVSQRRQRRVQLAFDLPPPEFVSEGRVWIELLPNDVTYQRARAAVAAVQSWDSGRRRRRRDILLGAASPRFGSAPPRTLEVSLNPEQAAAVQRALVAKDFFLVHGPPGTGKSTVLAELAAQIGRDGRRLLCTAASNAAVDHLLELCLARGLRAVRIGHPARVAERLQARCLDTLVEAHPERQVARDLFDEAHSLMGYARRQRSQGRQAARFSNARDAQGQARALIKEARQHEARAVASVMTDAQVVCATCTALGGEELRDQSFDWALFDEATQATEPLALLAWARAERLILAGDPCQLPPTVVSPEAERQGLGISLFERLLETHADVGLMLREQYRMHETLIRFPSDVMYGGALRAAPAIATHTLADVLPAGADLDALDVPPLVFVDTAGMGFDEEKPESVLSFQGSLCNRGEADIILRRVEELVGAGLTPAELGVIAPYRAQARHLREALAEHLPEVEVDTVDAFQGREKDAILLTLTRSNDAGSLGFLTDRRRMNVALTRARRHLFIVGDSGTVGADPFFERLLAHVEAAAGYRSGWAWRAAPA